MEATLMTLVKKGPEICVPWIIEEDMLEVLPRNCQEYF